MKKKSHLDLMWLHQDLKKVIFSSTTLPLPPSCISFFLSRASSLLSLPPKPSILPLLTRSFPCPPLCAAAAVGKGPGGCLKSHRGYLIRNSRSSSTYLRRACWRSVAYVGFRRERGGKNQGRDCGRWGNRQHRENVAAAVEGQGIEVIGRGKGTG